MSVASTTRTIKFITKAGTYTALIMSPSGDLFQHWKGTTGNVTSVTPDFTALQPVLYFVCTSSRVAEGVATPQSIKFYFNGTEITFSGDTSTGTFAGYFKKVAPAGDNLYYGLQIVKNIVELSNYAPATIKMEATVEYGSQSDTIQASYTIPVQKSTGTDTYVTIVDGRTTSDGTDVDANFVITKKGNKVKLKAMAYEGSSEKTANLTYQWEKMDATGWTVLTLQTNQTLEVCDDDISTYGEFRVTVYQNGTELGTDIQGVMDASDPYELDPCPTPADETIYEDDNTSKVTYAPKVVDRRTGTQDTSFTQFYFVVKDAAGVILNKYQDGNVAESSIEATTYAASSYDVTWAQCVQAGGDVSITITTVS